MNSATLFGVTVASPDTGDYFTAAAIVFAAIASIWAIKKVIALGNKS
jgi:hypothetical protein